MAVPPDEVVFVESLHDAKGLIRESYRIEGIAYADCRTIFFDWALSLTGDLDAKTAIRACLGFYAQHALDHPMTAVLEEGLASVAQVGRRGGRKARIGQD